MQKNSDPLVRHFQQQPTMGVNKPDPSGGRNQEEVLEVDRTHVEEAPNCVTRHAFTWNPQGQGRRERPQNTLCREKEAALSNNDEMFGMRFSPSKCKLLLQEWPESTPELRIWSEAVERVDNFTYLESLISPNGLVSDEISARTRKARLVFTNLRHLWRRRDIRLSIKGRV
ncbi:unnamed protein product [Schistosoma mattheei]|uniref:Uncharacterized protein n=1 Tax=Schistosoma mattheei TaxID=31246 RepID=A0A183PD73_9TREM|nr:unnamed protein product [Schistosoma mattheei]